jgi:hypothetical protein
MTMPISTSLTALLTSLDTDLCEDVLTKRPSDAAPSLSFLLRPPPPDSSLFNPEDLADDCLPGDFLDDLKASLPDGTLGNDLLPAPPDTNSLDESPEPCLPDNDPLDEYDELLDLDLLDELLGDLPDLDLLSERLDDLLDLDLDDLLDLELLDELPDDLLALDLLTELLLSDLLASALDADLLDDPAAADPLEDEPLDPLLDVPSTNPGEEAAPDLTPCEHDDLETFLDDDDDSSLESTS